MRKNSNLRTGSWTGPLESPFGWHLVYIFEKLEGEVPDLEDVWDQVEREWTVERKKEIKEEQYRIMREQYKIVVEEQ
jgi:parvulin-like peptidyl-prolyl isomerase